jgi:hypothetical protein
MGYVHDTSMVEVIPLEQTTFYGGTWSDIVLGGNLWCKRRTAADSTFTVKLPLPLPQSSAPGKGAWLQAVEVFYKVGSGGIDALSAAIYQTTLPLDGAAFTAAQTQSFSYDTGHDTAAERIDNDEHRMTLTLETPLLMEAGKLAHLELAGDGSLTATFELYAVQAYYTLRL